MYRQDTRQARDYFAQKVAFNTGPHEVDAMLKRGEPVRVVDVRSPGDFAQGHVPGAINLPKGKWHTACGLDREVLTVVYCRHQTCKLAAEAAVELAQRGYPVCEMEGGFDTWERFGLPIESSTRPESAVAP